MSELTVGRRNLYILPTRVGWYFSLILIALFAIAIKFDNQSAFLMLFVLGAVGVIVMHETHNNVINLCLISGSSSSVFAGEVSKFSICIRNPGNSARTSLWLICHGFKKLLNLQAKSDIEIAVEINTYKRGWLDCPPVSLTSQYPMGIFFCWSKRFNPGLSCLVYPEPKKLLPLPAPSLGDELEFSNTTNTTMDSDREFKGMKTYQAGDRVRDIHWPSLARTQKLISKEHETPGGGAIAIAWSALPNSLSSEDRLSQLCQWCLEAESQGLYYQLEIPGKTLAFSRGNQHLHECLRALALANF